MPFTEQLPLCHHKVHLKVTVECPSEVKERQGERVLNIGMAMRQGEAGGHGPKSYGITILGKALKPYFQLGLTWKEAMGRVVI